MEMAASDSVLRRRNGRPQACDPCRSRKVSCDHTQPVCLRCQRRKQQQKCVYTISSHSVPVPSAGGRTTPTPIQRSRPSVTRRSHPTRASSSSSSPVSLLISPDTVAPFQPQPVSSHTGSPKPTSTASSSTTPAAAPRRSGYLGSTSYSAVYEETTHSLSRLQGGPSVPVLPQTAQQDGAAARASAEALWPVTREMSLAVLRCLPDLAATSIPPGMSPNICDGWTRVVVRRILHSLKVYFGGYCSRDIGDSRLEELARLLCANTSKPVTDDATDMNSWLDQFCDENLRWESVGILFTSQDLFPPIEDDEKGQPLMCVQLCVELAKKFSNGNLLQLHLCFRRTIMESRGVGDAGFACWRAHAEAVSLLTFLGLHAEHETPSYRPTFISELRRRLFAYVFNIDKVVTSFQGRPPMLSYCYVSSPLPLDIPDLAFVGTEDDLQRASADLDHNGWNHTGDPSSSTLIRARVKLAYVKDELISMVLSSNKPTSAETLLNIKARTAEVVAEFPPSLRYHPTDIDNKDLDAEILYARLLIRIEHLQSLFFAERLLQRHAAEHHSDNGELLLISFDMVVSTLTFWMHTDIFLEMSKDFEWLVMNYAAPGGGILCMELLRPTFTGPHHPRNSKITRSTLIQQLSLLVGFLGWVSPDAPNADLCASCRTVIQHVLDHTLNGGGFIPEQQDNGFDQSLGDALGQVIDTDNLFFSFDLLDTYDWLRPDDMGTENVSI